MEKKDLLNAEIQLFSISITLLLGTGAGFGFLLNFPAINENLLLQCFLIVVGFLVILSAFWAILLYSNIHNLK